MEGQTNCVICEYKSRSTGSLKQHMETKHNVFNMTIVQVLTQQVERVNDLESQIKAKEQLIKMSEVDLNVTKEALKKEKESLEEKEKAFDDIITSQKQKAVEESMLVEELKLTKGLLDKAHQDLEAKTNDLDAELNKVREGVSSVSTQTVSTMNEVADMKQEETEAHIEAKNKNIPCKYFQRFKGCRRGNMCWFSHDESHKTEKKCKEMKQTPIQKFKYEQNKDKETKQEQGEALIIVVLELVKLLLKEKHMQATKT